MFSEFRQDWRAAVQEYLNTWMYLKQVPLRPQQQQPGSSGSGGGSSGAAGVGGSSCDLRLLLEVCRVAELVQLKMLMLMLHQVGKGGGGALHLLLRWWLHLVMMMVMHLLLLLLLQGRIEEAVQQVRDLMSHFDKLAGVCGVWGGVWGAGLLRLSTTGTQN